MAKDKSQKNLLIAQEIKFARVLSSNDKRARMKMLKKLRNWINIRSKSSFAFTEADFMRLWKGLFYCMWLSDKPLVQEELAESISNLVHSIESMEMALLYTKCTLRTLSSEWFGLDWYRMDKFEMLARRIMRQSFVMCKKSSWDEEWVKGVSKIIEDILLDPKGSMGFKFHITEIFIEELAKISEGKIANEIVTEFLRPFAVYLATMTDDRQIRHVMKHIFRYLIFQSDAGLEYAEKFEAWRKAGFPKGDISVMEKIPIADENSENEEKESDYESDSNNDDGDDSIDQFRQKALDPRAGRVDVELPQVPFDAEQIANLLKTYKFHESSTTKNRRQIKKLIDEFDELAKGNMPLGVKKVDVLTGKKKGIAKTAALKLLNFEEKLYNDSHKRMKRKKKNKPIVNSENSVENDINDNEDDIEPEVGPPLKKKKKKQKLIVENNFTVEENDTENEFHDEKIIKQKRKKNKAIEEVEEVNDTKIIKKSKLKQKLMKDESPKEKKIKTKKLKNKKKSLKNLIFDGMEDFVHFKQSAEIKKKKKKKVKQDLENSGNFLNTECSSTSTVAAIPMTNGSSSPEKKVKAKETLSEVNTPKIKTSPQKVSHSPKLEKLENGVVSKTITSPKKLNIDSSIKKRVKIMLNRNTAQHTSEYIQQIRSSPAIPFDANRKPLNGVLKPSPISSPINPFYKK
ncbi:ribosomal RNA processing protein 1 homolog [Chelonus insularis]|uniref:ribosomal RNA processing protein 1 homolog n=1 Tax=Chelonus insularis TaxID=460826 RepID=UPI001589CFDF|nr:ribosomal RNA processing protein 1 homolog [Chelonus insularis]